MHCSWRKVISTTLTACGNIIRQSELTSDGFVKKRRNNRVLEKFYYAKYIDIRDGSRKSGSQLSCNRTNSREPRVSDKSLRPFRGQKVSKGRRSIRRQRYALQPGDIIAFYGQRYKVKGVQNKGAYVAVEGRTPIAVKKVAVVSRVNGWTELFG